MAANKKYNCTKNGKQYYRISKVIDGKRKEFYGDGKRDAERKLAEYLEKYEAEKKSPSRGGAARLVRDSIKEWFFEVKKLQCKKLSTFDRYELMYRKQVVECGLCGSCELLDSAISEVDRSLIKRCVFRMEKDISKSAGSIDSFLTVVKQYFEYLLDEEIIDGLNPCRKLKAVREIEVNDKEDEKYISKETRELLKTVLSETEEVYRMAFVLGFNSGLREAELCALEWDDVLFGKGLRINKTLSYPRVFDDDGGHHREVVVQAPKGNKSRFVALPEHIWVMLKDYKAWQNKEALQRGWGKPKTVLHGTLGGYMLPKNLLRAFKRIQTRAGITDVKRFHDIRHTYITELAVQENIPLSIVQSTAGHSDLKITEHYIHATESANVEALKDVIVF